MAFVALIGKNSIEYVNILLNIWNKEDCAVLIDWQMPNNKVNGILDYLNIKDCYVDSSIHYEGVVCQNLHVYKSNQKGTLVIPESITNKFKANYSEKDAVILFSSGTTGLRKGVILSFKAINNNADSVTKYMKINKGDRLYIAKTLSHSSTLVGELLVALKTKAKIYIGPTIISPKSIANNIDENDITIICLNPTLLNLLTKEIEKSKYVFDNLRCVYVSGEVLNNRLFINAQNAFQNKVYNVYGLTEAGPRVSAQRIGENQGNNVGQVIDGVNIKILDYKGNQVELGKIGLIYVKSNSLFSRYIDGTKCDKDAWLKTNDLGFFDKKNNLIVIGRSDEVIIVNSHNIYPSDIENKINNISDIVECKVIKLDINRVILCCAYCGQIDESALYRNLQNELLPYELPQCFIKFDKLPRNTNQKIDVNLLIKMCREKYEKTNNLY